MIVRNRCSERSDRIVGLLHEVLVRGLRVLLCCDGLCLQLLGVIDDGLDHRNNFATTSVLPASCEAGRAIAWICVCGRSLDVWRTRSLLLVLLNIVGLQKRRGSPTMMDM